MNIMPTEEYERHVKLSAAILSNDKTWLDEVVKICGDYYANNPCGGNLHVVLEDGNLEENHIAWCEGYCCGVEDKKGAFIMRMMRMMKMRQRKRLYELWPYSKYREEV